MDKFNKIMAIGVAAFLVISWVCVVSGSRYEFVTFKPQVEKKMKELEERQQALEERLRTKGERQQALEDRMEELSKQKDSTRAIDQQKKQQKKKK